MVVAVSAAGWWLCWSWLVVDNGGGVVLETLEIYFPDLGYKNSIHEVLYVVCTGSERWAKNGGDHMYRGNSAWHMHVYVPMYPRLPRRVHLSTLISPAID